MLHAQLYFLFVFEARNVISLLFGVNKVLVLVLVTELPHGEGAISTRLLPLSVDFFLYINMAMCF